MIDEARDQAARMQNLVGVKGVKEDYDLAEDIINDIDRKDLLKEIIGLEEKLIDNKKKARIARNEAAREVYNEKVALYEQELRQKKQAVEEIEHEQKEKKRKYKFDEFLKGEFNGFRSDQFETILPGVDRLVIQHGPIDQDNGLISSDILIVFIALGEYTARQTYKRSSFGVIFDL